MRIMIGLGPPHPTPLVSEVGGSGPVGGWGF